MMCSVLIGQQVIGWHWHGGLSCVHIAQFLAMWSCDHCWCHGCGVKVVHSACIADVLVFYWLLTFWGARDCCELKHRSLDVPRKGWDQRPCFKMSWVPKTWLLEFKFKLVDGFHDKRYPEFMVFLAVSWSGWWHRLLQSGLVSWVIACRCFSIWGG